MPTGHKRHSVTETPEVARAPAPLRERLGEVRLGELVLGAQEKLRRSERDDGEARQARERLARRVLERRGGADPVLADRVRHEGWSRA